ncbi:MAG: hypothetical protein AB1414_02555 [bacterium]
MTKFPTKIIMDTGPLFDLLLANCWWKYFRTFPTEHLRYIRNERQYKNLRDYIFSIELILITPYVLAEINYQLRKIKDKDGIYNKFWKLTIELLKDNKFQEGVIKIVEIDLQALSNFGLTDAVLILLTGNTRLPIFTGDSPLKNYCKVKGLDSLFIYDITESKFR